MKGAFSITIILMYRFYYPHTIEGTTTVINDSELLHQIGRVLRLQSGDSFVLFNEKTECTITILDISKSEITGNVSEHNLCSCDADREVVLYQGLLKSDKFEWVLQKVTELGVSRIVPIVSEHCVVKDISENKKARYNKIIKEAVEQCGGCAIPDLEQSISFSQALEQLPKKAKLLICHEKEESLSLLTALENNDATSLHIFVGPEGGFSEQEIEAAQKGGLEVVHLGKRVLRAETASIIAAGLAVSIS